MDILLLNLAHTYMRRDTERDENLEVYLAKKKKPVLYIGT